jgi:hypothetical protein
LGKCSIKEHHNLRNLAQIWSQRLNQNCSLPERAAAAGVKAEAAAVVAGEEVTRTEVLTDQVGRAFIPICVRVFLMPRVTSSLTACYLLNR